MARITRKELKSDKFAQDIGLTFTFFEEHKKAIARYGAIALAVVVLVVGYSAYARHQHGARQEALYKAITAQEAPVGAAAVVACFGSEGPVSPGGAGGALATTTMAGRSSRSPTR